MSDVYHCVCKRNWSFILRKRAHIGPRFKVNLQRAAAISACAISLKQFRVFRSKRGRPYVHRMELGSSSSEDELPMVMLEPAGRGQGLNKLYDLGSSISYRRADKIVLSSDSETEMNSNKTKAGNALVSPSISSSQRLQLAGSTIVEPRCHNAASVAFKTDSTILPPTETANEAERRQVGD